MSSQIEDAAVKPRKPTIDNHGIVAFHDQCCAVNWNDSAVLNLDKGVFEPSWTAQGEGWRLVHANTWWKRLLVKLVQP